MPAPLLDSLDMHRAIKMEPIFTTILAFIDHDRDAIDVGANVGLYTLAFKKKARNAIAFEPVPALAAALKRRHGSSVQVFEHALGNEDRTTTLFVPYEGDRPVESRASLNVDANKGFALQSIQVQVHRLDSYCFNNVGIIKIDVEGHELEVLLGAENTIQESHPVLVIEIEERHHPGRSWDIINYVRGLGYNGFFCRAGELLTIDSFDFATMQLQSNLKAAFEPKKEEYINDFIFIPRN